MNRDIHPNNFDAPSLLGNGGFQLARPQLIPRAGYIPNPNTNPPRLPAGVIPYNNFVLTPVPRVSIAPRTRGPQYKSRETRFRPRQIVTAKEFASFTMSLIKSPTASLALQFIQLRRVDAEIAILKAVNEELCAHDLLGIYSESPFYRPVLLLREVQFATPTTTMFQFPDPENMVRQLRDLADQKVASVPLMGMVSGSKPTASSLGFSTEYLMHVFNVELDLNLIAFLNEQSKLGNPAADRYRVILRFGWATQGLSVAPTTVGSSASTAAPRFLAAEALPRCLQLRVARRQVALPEPIFHAGQAVKLGHRLRYSVDITDKIPLRAANLVRSRNIEIEMTWLHVPLEDHAHALLESVTTGALTPIINHVITMPLVQVTLDRVESLPKIIRNFSLAVAGRPTGEVNANSPHPPPMNGFSLPTFTPERLNGVYDFCASSERVISVDKTLEMLKKKMAFHDDLLCDDWIPVTLLCPLTLTRIEVPIRSVNCNHLQCFDLASYLTINRRRPRWNCPVCSRPSPFRDLRRDDFFLRLLKDKSLADAEHVKVDAEGNCRKVLTESTASTTGDNSDLKSHKSHHDGDGSGGGSGDAPSVTTPYKADPFSRSKGSRPEASSSSSPSQRRHPPSPCILVIDDSDSDDNEENAEKGHTEATSSAAPPSQMPQQTQSTSTLPAVLTFTSSSPSASPAPAPAPPPASGIPPLSSTAMSQVFSGNLVVDLTELSDDSDDDKSPPAPPPPLKSLRAVSGSPPPVPLPPAPLPAPPVASPLSPPPEVATTGTVPRTPILVIPTETTTPSIGGATNASTVTAPAAISGQSGAVASDLQPRLFTPLSPVSASRILFLSNPQTIAASTLPPNSTATLVPRSLVNTELTAAAATSVTFSNSAKRPLASPTTTATSSSCSLDSTGSSRSGRFKITAKRRCILSPPPAASVEPPTLPGGPVVIIPTPLVTATAANPPLTATVTTPATAPTAAVLPPVIPAHCLRSSRQIHPPQPVPAPAPTPAPSSKSVARRGRARRRVFIDDNGSDFASPTGAGEAPFEPSASTSAAEDEAIDDEDEEEAADDDDDDDWTPSTFSSNSAPNSSRRRSAAAVPASKRKSLTPGGSEGSRSRRG